MISSSTLFHLDGSPGSRNPCRLQIRLFNFSRSMLWSEWGGDWTYHWSFGFVSFLVAVWFIVPRLRILNFIVSNPLFMCPPSYRFRTFVSSVPYPFAVYVHPIPSLAAIIPNVLQHVSSVISSLGPVLVYSSSPAYSL